MNECRHKVLQRLMVLLVLLPALGGCASLPPLKPLTLSQEPLAYEACRRPFLVEKVRLVHELKTVMPGEYEGQAIGVLLADPATRSFESVLMTIEGLVLFDMTSGATPSVHRAVPPFDTPALAGRMAEDISLAFFSPGDQPKAVGREKGGAAVCRYTRPGGETVDVRTAGDGALEIRLYGAGQELRKKVSIPHLARPGLADELEIQGTAWPSYSLRLRLIAVEAVQE